MKVRNHENHSAKVQCAQLELAQCAVDHRRVEMALTAEAVARVAQCDLRATAAEPRCVQIGGDVALDHPDREVVRQLVDVFAVTDRQGRGIGLIAKSGWALSSRDAEFDAERRFDVGHMHVAESPHCHSGEVLLGQLKPAGCPAFGLSCTPRNPLGATMVSSEGACAA